MVWSFIMPSTMSGVDMVSPLPLMMPSHTTSNHLVAVGVVGHGDRVQRGADAELALRVGGHEADGVGQREAERHPVRRRLRQRRPRV